MVFNNIPRLLCHQIKKSNILNKISHIISVVKKKFAEIYEESVHFFESTSYFNKNDRSVCIYLHTILYIYIYIYIYI